MANRFNKCFPSFISLHSEFSSGLRVIDNFSDRISFYVHDKGKDNKSHTHQLDNMVLEFSSFFSTTIIVSNASIKKCCNIYLAYTYKQQNPNKDNPSHSSYYKH